MEGSVFKAAGKAFLSLSAGMSKLAAFWIFVLMVFMIADILGRVLFNHPLQGTYEIVKVSIVGIVFLQAPHTLWRDRHIRSHLLLATLGPRPREVLNTFTHLLGTAVFALIFLSNWAPTLLSWRILEIEGDGTLRVPVYPVRSILLLGSAVMIVHFLGKAFQSLCVVLGKSK